MLADPTINHANLGKYIDDMTVSEVMIAEPETLSGPTDIEVALATMTDLGFRFMPVVNDERRGRLLGLVDERELAIHVKIQLDRVKREAAEKDGLLQHLSREPYGFDGGRSG